MKKVKICVGTLASHSKSWKNKNFPQFILYLYNNFLSLSKSPPISHFWIIFHSLEYIIKIVQNPQDSPNILFLFADLPNQRKNVPTEKKLFFSYIQTWSHEQTISSRKASIASIADLGNLEGTLSSSVGVSEGGILLRKF